MAQNVQFQDDQATSSSVLYARFQRSRQVPGIVRFLMEHNVVKSEQVAVKLLVWLSVAAVVISVIIFAWSTAPKSIHLIQVNSSPSAVNTK